jgi:hypothetical protein
VGTGAAYVSVGQEASARVAVQLLYRLLADITGRVDVLEQLLHDLGLARRRGAAELVERYAEPLVDVTVDRIEARAELRRCYALLRGLGLGGGTVFVGPADVQRLEPAEPRTAGEYVGGKHLDKVAEMGDIVHVRESTGYKASFHGGVTIRKAKNAVNGATDRRPEGQNTTLASRLSL